MSENGKLTISVNRETFTYEFDNWDLTLDQLFDAFIGGLRTLTFSEKQIRNYILERAEEIVEE